MEKNYITFYTQLPSTNEFISILFGNSKEKLADIIAKLTASIFYMTLNNFPALLKEKNEELERALIETVSADFAALPDKNPASEYSTNFPASDNLNGTCIATESLPRNFKTDTWRSMCAGIRTDLLREIFSSDTIRPVTDKQHIMVIHYKKNLRSDHDNLDFKIKFLLDALVAAEILRNDTPDFVEDIYHAHKLDRSNPRIELHLIPAEQYDIQVRRKTA